MSVFGVLALIFALTKTKTATNEARVGHYEFILLPSGNRIHGLVTLARKLVLPQFTFELARDEISEAQAKKLQETFDNNLHFYAFRGGRGKYLVVSTKNLEDPEFALVTSESFMFPFGFITRRLVLGDATETQRSGWKVINIEPRSLKTGLSPKIFETMTDIGETCASVKEIAIRIKKELPWKEVARAREKQLRKAHNEVAKAKGETAKIRLALTSKPLFQQEPAISKVPFPEKEGIFNFWRVATAIIVFFIAFSFLPTWLPIIKDPLVPSIIFAVVAFALYSRVKERLLKRFL